jgi:SNF2 family DNA or RNA helicase
MLTVRHRDVAFESEARERLNAFGAREQWDYDERRKRLTITAKRLPTLVNELVAAGWSVEVDGATYRSAGVPHAKVRSGVDWFELDAGVRFGDLDVSLGDILAARRAHETTVLLPDGSRGLLPLDWLARLGPLLAGGTVQNGALRYTKSQTGLLDALLATLPEADVDATFARARAELRTFATVAPLDPPDTFRGTLREYQREGLGWLHFLRKFELGGCLADDMGLGKTVQVLALLDSRCGTPENPNAPSIVVVPRSLVFNWFREAERFTPRLRLLDYTGIGRDFDAIQSGKFDVVLTTFGTLRRDAPRLAAIEFDYAILDEAQAIKTGGSASAKAARLLRAKHRLAITGTPIENRLEELWSLFEFLNPGMLGTSSAFAALSRLTDETDEMPANRDVLARALRPVILRRTKNQVARDLPPRIEQTLEVDLEGPQRKFYDDLLEAYRRSVIERVDRAGIGKSKMHILEALLRLRQAACHPVLADPRKSGAPSAKLDALIPALEEVIAEGHKALVFSQFTSFLALLRERLDAANVPYEYLDGKTRNREGAVDRFQSDPSCSLFLISLKAGGHGLNLTAADYVFILDPWWNPAVEAQAIDRAHRIGQTRHVIATRIVARNTIEEKILALQASKRALADAILGQDQGVLAGIGREELEMLLG